MVEHLIDYAVVKNTFVLTKKTGQYKEIGFKQTNEPVGDLVDRIADECARSGRKTEMLMVYRK